MTRLIAGLALLFLVGGSATRRPERPAHEACPAGGQPLAGIGSVPRISGKNAVYDADGRDLVAGPPVRIG